MAISISTLRQNIYKLLDQVLEDGTPLVIDRNGKKLIIMPAPDQEKMKKLRKREIMKCDPEELVHMDWSEEWKP
jgi:prevent-host-death family protein